VNDSPVTFQRGDFLVTTDRARIDVDTALGLLRATFWARDMTREVLDRALTNSVSFGLLERNQLIGLGRVVTDLATYAYWTDVVVAEPYRGRGLGRWLSECMLSHPALQGFRRVALLTRDAESLYSGIGFTVGPGSLIYMERKP
jgi:GNAT superfamily N-acetyltransferase